MKTKTEVYEGMRSFINDMAEYKFSDEVVMTDGRVQSEALREKYDYMVRWSRTLRKEFRSLSPDRREDDLSIGPLNFTELEREETIVQRQFVEAAIHTACKAFANDDGIIPPSYEYHANLSYISSTVWNDVQKDVCDVCDPQSKFKPRGLFHYTHNCVADLSLVCGYLRRVGVHYLVFFDTQSPQDWVIWTPTMEDWEELSDS